MFIKSVISLGVLCVVGIVCWIGYVEQRDNAQEQNRKNLIEQVQKHHPGLNLMANDTITMEQLQVLDKIFYDMRDVYGDSIRFSAFEVTEKEYHTILGEQYDESKASLPMTEVSFGRVQQFIMELNEIINSAETNIEFSLPTKEEWEYAASDGDVENGTQYAGSDNIDEVAWYKGNAEGKPHPADGQSELKPNKFGLYDMSGNVCEHVFTPFVNLNNPENTTNMMLIKGGSYASEPNECKISNETPLETDLSSPKVGFRLVLRKK